MTTLVFPPGTRDWERRRVTVRPSLPAKTAMVLLELHQPAGSAWFDDLHLSREGRPGENLLLFPGFEPEPELLERSELSCSEYEAIVAGILRTLGQARREPGAEPIRVAAAVVEEARRWLDASGLARLWGYEWRDLEDASRRLARCAEVVRG